MVIGSTVSATSTALSTLSRPSARLISGVRARATTVTTTAVRLLTPTRLRSMAPTSSGAEATRRAPVACNPSWSTERISSRPMAAAKPPYALGPRRRAATMV